MTRIRLSRSKEAQRFRRSAPLTLAPIRPNVGVQMIYQQKLLDMIAEMNGSVMYWVGARYKANEPAIAQVAQDELPANALKKALAMLVKRWQKNFDRLSHDLAKYFAMDVSKRSASALKSKLKKAGFTVEFRMTRAMKDALEATIQQQVSLIKSIPQKYFTNVEGAVMRSVAAGHDLATLTKNLQKNYGVTRRRAELIARDQNNKATATLTRVRQVELGIKEAIWMHSTAGKEPRPTHLAAGRRKQRYDVTKGWYDPHEKKFIYPGELINCRCVSRSVIPGL